MHKFGFCLGNREFLLNYLGLTQKQKVINEINFHRCLGTLKAIEHGSDAVAE